MPDAHALVVAQPAGKPLPRARCRARSGWRARSLTHAGQARRRRGAGGKLRREQRDARRLQPPGAPATPRHCPTGPRHHITSKSPGMFTAAGRPRSRRGMWPPNPQLTRDSACLAPGSVEQHHAQAAQRCARRKLQREQSHQPVGEMDHAAPVSRAGALIGLEHRRRRGPRPRDQFRQHRSVTQAEIESLCGDGMQRLRGIAHQHARVPVICARASANG